MATAATRPRQTRGETIAPAMLLAMALGCGPCFGEGPVISEFMAVNNSVLRDADGEYSDWIEIHNPTTAAVSLAGWSLTDTATNLVRWTFPATQLPARAFLVVFASGKDRRVAGAELHTGFRLSADGEFLALVEPDGRTVAHAFAPAYPAQIPDLSYGLESETNAWRVLLGAGAPCRAVVPPDGRYDGSWTAETFDDAGWRSGATGAGYERGSGYQTLIRTDLNADMYGKSCSAYLRVPFVPDEVVGVVSLTLRMKYDDGFVAYLNGREVARANAPSSTAWNSSASSDHPDAESLVFRDFAIAGADLLHSGTNRLAIHGLNVNATSSDFLIVPELNAEFASTNGVGRPGYFASPTPGRGNGRSQLLPSAATVAFSVPARTFISPFDIELSTTNPPGLVIRYTLDGSVPQALSPACTSAIPISATTLVRARAFEPGRDPGPVADCAYVKIAPGLADFTSDLPLVIVETFGNGNVSDTMQAPAYLMIFEPRSGRTSLTHWPALNTRAGIRRRGETSLRALNSHPNLAVEAWNERNEDKTIAPLGMPPESDWILYAPYTFDLAYVNNPFIFELSRQMGPYAPRTRWIEVFLHYTAGDLAYSHYVGIYAFEERIKRADKRVNVERLTPADVSEPAIRGGYLVKIDKPDPDKQAFSVTGQNSLYHVYPHDQDLVDAQKNWIRGHLDEFGRVLAGAAFRDPLNGYLKYVDVPPSIDHHILNVLAKNADALRLSTYIYKPRAGKLIWGPVWDFDRAMDSTDGRDDAPDGWTGGTDYFHYQWWNRLFQDPDFAQAWVDRWQQRRPGVLSDTNMFAIIDGLAAELTEAQVRNLQVRTAPRFGGWQGEITHIKNWLSTRAKWIDGQFLAPPVFASAGGRFASPFLLGIEPRSGTSIYFTTNGVDPRASGGTVAFGAIPYEAPIRLVRSATVRARATNGRAYAAWPDAPWSGLAEASFVIGEPRLAVTEIMHSPRSPRGAETNAAGAASDFEFVELKNVGTGVMLLQGVRVTSDVEFEFPAAVPQALAPGECVVLAAHPGAFACRYAGRGLIRVAGAYAGRLAGRDGELSVLGPDGAMLTEAAWSEGPPAADGAGHSLVPLLTGAAGTDAPRPDAWRASSFLDGSPGVDDPPVATNLLLNEIVAHTDVDLPPYDSNDAIEIFNASSNPVAMAGWFLSDDAGNLRKWAIPSSSVAPPGGWLAFDEMTGFHTPLTNGFGLNKAGETVFLSHLPGSDLDRVADAFRFPAQERGVSYGRSPDGGPYWAAMPVSTGAANAAAVADVVISELMYHAPSFGRLSADDAVAEYVEIHNPTASRIDLWGTAGAWRLDGGIRYSFPPGVSLPAGGRLAVVAFDPGDPLRLKTFTDAYPNAEGGIRLFGPFSGRLANEGEYLALQRPQPSDDPMLATEVSWVVVDEVSYGATPPWPPEADGLGRALQRRRVAGSGLDPARWSTGAAPTPGGPPAVVGLASPHHGNSFALPFATPVRAECDAEWTSGAVRRVDFLLDGEAVVTLTNAPYEAPLTSMVRTGMHTLAAALLDEAGSHTSPPVRIVVERLSVETRGASNVTSHSAEIHGALVDGTAAEVWLFWGRQDSGTRRDGWDRATRVGQVLEGAFVARLSGLIPGFPYFYRAQATNASGSAWSEVGRPFAAAATPYARWAFRAKVRFAGCDPREALTNFPALVVLEDDAHGFRHADVAQTENGADLRFADASESRELNHEVESWNTAGRSTVWIQVPRLSTPDDFVWMYWGNPSAAGLLPCRTNGAVWSGGYTGVWHLNARTLAGVFPDSSRGLSHASTVGAPVSVPGPTASGVAMDGDDALICGDRPSLRLSATATVEAWIKLMDTAGTMLAVSKKSVWNAANGYELELNTLGGTATILAGGADTARGIAYWTTTAWHHVAATFNGASARFFFDGQPKSMSDSAIGVLTADATALYLGRRSGGGGNLRGSLDEVRLSSVPRSAEWLRIGWLNVASNAQSIRIEDITALGSDAPIIANAEATQVSTDSAQLNAFLHSTGAAQTVISAFWACSDGGTNRGRWDARSDLGPRSAGPIALRVERLQPGTFYCFRFMAANAFGEHWAGATSGFRTIGPPLAANGVASNVTPATATFTGALLSTGGAHTAVFVCWGLSDGRTAAQAWDHVVDLGVRPPGPLAASVSGLAPGATHYYRFRATNVFGEHWADPAAVVLTPAVFVWDGGGADDRWSTPGNWDHDAVPPAKGQADIAFAGAVRRTSFVDRPWDVRSLSFDTGPGPFVLRGSNLTVRAGGIALRAPGQTQVLSNAVHVPEPQVWRVADPSSSLLVAGDLSGSGNLTYDLAADRALALAGANADFTGTMAALDDDRGPILLCARATIGGHIPLNAGHRTLFLNGGAEPGVYTLGVGGGPGQVAFRGAGDGGIVAVGGDVTWDPGAGGDCAWPAMPIDFQQAAGSDAAFRFGNSNGVLRLTSDSGELRVKAGKTTVLFALADDGEARCLEIHGAGACLLTRPASADSHPDSWTEVHGTLALTASEQIFGGPLLVWGCLVLDGVPWPEFLANRAEGYGTGRRQWHLSTPGASLAARGADLLVDAGDWVMDFALGSSLVLDGAQFANRAVILSVDLNLGNREYVWRFRGRNRESDTGWTLDGAVAEIAGRISGGGPDAQINLLGQGEGDAFAGGSVRISNTNNAFAAEIRVCSHDGACNAPPPSGAWVRDDCAGVALIIPGDGALGLPGNAVFVGAGDADRFNDGMLLFENSGPGTNEFRRDFCVLNGPTDGRANGDRAGDSGFGSFRGAVRYRGAITLLGANDSASAQTMPVHVAVGALVLDGAAIRNLRGVPNRYQKTGGGELILADVACTGAEYEWRLHAGVLATRRPGLLRSSGAVRWDDLFNTGSTNRRVWRAEGADQSYTMAGGRYEDNTGICVGPGVLLTTTSRDETEELVAAAEGATLRKTGTGTWHYEAGADINNDGASGCIVIEQGVLDAAGNMGNTGLRLAGGTLLSGSSSSFAGDAGTGSTDEKPFYVGPAGGKLGISPAAAGDVHRGSPITEWDQTGAGTLTLASRADHSLLLDHEAFPDVNAHTTLRIERDEPGSGVVHLGDTTVTVRGTLAGAGTLRLGADATGILRIEGTLTPATDGTPGELAVAGHVVMAPAAALRFDLGPTNASDRFTVGGDLTLDGTVALRRRPGMPDGTNDWILIRYGGALSGPGLRVVPPYGPFAAEVDTSRPGEVRVRVTGAPEPDDDRDGIPNVWEAAHGLNPLSSNEGDSDDDGATDYEEYLADTHPGDPASRLHIESVAMGGGTLTLYFQSSSERVYAVRWWADLSAPESWAQLTNAMRGGGGPVILPCREAPGRAFYRVHARLPD